MKVMFQVTALVGDEKGWPSEMAMRGTLRTAHDLRQLEERGGTAFSGDRFIGKVQYRRCDGDALKNSDFESDPDSDCRDETPTMLRWSGLVPQGQTKLTKNSSNSGKSDQ